MQEKYTIGLWEKESKNKQKYCNGKVYLNNIAYKVLLFKNQNKKSDKSPDFTILLSKI